MRSRKLNEREWLKAQIRRANEYVLEIVKTSCFAQTKATFDNYKSPKSIWFSLSFISLVKSLAFHASMITAVHAAKKGISPASAIQLLNSNTDINWAVVDRTNY